MKENIMVKFGPAGNDYTFYGEGYQHTYEAPFWLNKNNLSAYEYSFGRGITLKDDTALQIGIEMKKYNIAISIHAPYYINFASIEEEKIEKSYGYILNSLKILRILGGNRLIVHIGSCGKQERNVAIEKIKENLIKLDKILKENNFGDMLICIETMGKPMQIGTYEEILQFCTLSNQYIPTFDFGHINALTQGSLKTEKDYEAIIKRSIEVVGEEKTNMCHIHFSKIEYGAKGEIKHLDFDDNIYGPDFLPLAKVIKKYKLNPVIICESKGYQSRDSITMHNIYNNA